jgi:hypothetical protein
MALDPQIAQRIRKNESADYGENMNPQITQIHADLKKKIKPGAWADF